MTTGVTESGSHRAIMPISGYLTGVIIVVVIALFGIRGRFSSRTMKNILEEAAQMAREGVKEVNIISQDTTSYGVDLYGKRQLHLLLEKLAVIPVSNGYASFTPIRGILILNLFRL